MQGQIISYDSHAKFGMVADETGVQHKFPATEWRGQSAPVKGQKVEFDVDHGWAININPIGSASHNSQGGNGFNNMGATTAKTKAFADQAKAGIESVFSAPTEYAPPTFWQFYFSPMGRVSKKQYWWRYFFPGVIVGVILFAIVVVWMFEGFQDIPKRTTTIFTIIGMIVSLPLAWISYVIHVKRYHDLDNAQGVAWTILDDVVPEGYDIGGYTRGWNLLTQDGTFGPNQYGPDPKEWD